MFRSIFSRLFWTYAAIILVVFSVITGVVALFINHYNINMQKATIMSASSTLEYWTGTYQIEQSNNTLAEQAYKRTLQSWSDFLRADIVVVNTDGEIVGSSSSIETAPAEYVEEVCAGNVITKKGSFGGEYKERQFTIGVPIKYQDNIVAAMFFNMPLMIITHTTLEIVTIFLFCALCSLAFACLLIYIQAKRFSKPIGQINKAAQNIAAGNFSDRVEVSSNDEIGQLASSFNFMADSIEELEDMRSEFISDVSHELRTPMTSISGFAQSILDGTIPHENEDQYLKIIVDESRRLTKLVNDMLDMSKMSSSEYQLTIEKFDLNELVRTCIISLESRITDRNLDLNVDFEKDKLSVLGDKDSIKRVVLNLMDNAIKFSYEHTIINIGTKVADKKACFYIGNFGIGIDSKDLSSVFNRFYKTDKSRGKERSGAGLGLSLCKNILALHKQSIWVESNPAKEGSDVKYTQFSFTLEKA